MSKVSISEVADSTQNKYYFNEILKYNLQGSAMPVLTDSLWVSAQSATVPFPS